MEFFKKLSLPKNPLKDGQWFEPGNNKANDRYAKDFHQYNITVDALNDDVMDSFKEIGVVPTTLSVFIFKKTKKMKDALMHLDLVRDGETWIKVPFAINWEITNTSCILSWWETQKPEAWPNWREYFHINPQAIHYGHRRLITGVDDATEKLLCTTMTTQDPLLVRTNVPHTAHWLPPAEHVGKRIAISVRFSNLYHLTWDEALKKFEPLVLS